MLLFHYGLARQYGAIIILELSAGLLISLVLPRVSLSTRGFNTVLRFNTLNRADFGHCFFSLVPRHSGLYMMHKV
ncbi:MAG: hypothetical protein ACI9SK_001274 [Zhongshania sp.]|jgi:hypothetical protein